MQPRLSSINGSTRFVAVLGDPIAHTASPAMHNAAFEKLGLNWRYLALRVKPSDLRKSLQGLAVSGFVGVNLTVPLKTLALRMVDEIDPHAAQLGALNTLSFVPQGEKVILRGYNTDGPGLLKALKKTFSWSPQGQSIAILGCGGAGQGAALQLALAGAKRLVLLNRTQPRAQAVGRRIRSLRLPTSVSFRPEPCDLIIQATSLGLHSHDPSPLTSDLLDPLRPRFFFDMIYRPAVTPAMKLARERGCKVSHGLPMLLYQGAKAFEIWTRRKAPIQEMARALHQEIYGC